MTAAPADPLRDIEFAAIWAGVVANPADAAPKLVAADWLQESGADAELEAGLRWCAAEGKFPAGGPGGWAWFWYEGDPSDPPTVDRWQLDGPGWHRIPKDLWNAVMPDRILGDAFGTFDGNTLADPADHIRRLGRVLRAAGGGAGGQRA